MHINKLFAFSFLLIAIAPLASRADGTVGVCAPPPAPTEYQSHEDIVFKDKLGFDLYLPAQDSGAALPVAFIIHGGSWIQGDREEFDSLAQQLTAMGYAGVTVSYRLATNDAGRFPAPVEDLRCALKTLKSKSAEFHLNPNRIVAIGFSAGAHLAAELGLTSDNPAFSDVDCPVKEFTPEVQGVVGFYGPYDLRKTDGLNFMQISILSNFLGGMPSDNQALADLASPAAQITNQKIPFFLAQAANDDTVPVRSSREFNDALKLKNVPVKYAEIPDGMHGFPLFDDEPYAQPATCGVIQYLNDFLTP